MGLCCVEGCISNGNDEDISYFEFPTSRALRRKWLDVVNIGNKVPVGTVVCSRHFLREEYDSVRGKVRLNRKVVPSLLLENQTAGTIVKREASSKPLPNAPALESPRLKTQRQSGESVFETPQIENQREFQENPAFESPLGRSQRRSTKTSVLESTKIENQRELEKKHVVESSRGKSRRRSEKAAILESTQIKIQRESKKVPVNEPSRRKSRRQSERIALETTQINIQQESEKAPVLGPHRRKSRRQSERLSILDSTQITIQQEHEKTSLESPRIKIRRRSEKFPILESTLINVQLESDATPVVESPRRKGRRRSERAPALESTPPKSRCQTEKPAVLESSLTTSRLQPEIIPVLETPRIIIRREPQKTYSIYYPAKPVDDPDQNVKSTRKETTPNGGRGSKQVSEICTVVTKESVSTLVNTPQNTIDPLPDPIQPPDFEEMITNYQIKNKPNALRLDETVLEPAKECERDDTIVVDDKGDTPPVFIEISVDKESNPTSGNGQDCLMVLESVQVDVDPSTLMLPEREPEVPDNDSDVEIVIPERRHDPISLLTSSDEDEVILQEPKIDTVEISDDTDEDNIPLVQLVKTKPNKKKSKKKSKQGPKNAEDLRNIVWGCGYEFYCVKCPFVTSDSVVYDNHMQDHEKALHVCPVCSYATGSKSQYTRHLRKHKDEKNYQCHLCDYRAKHNMSLMYHLQSHKKDRGKVASVKKGFKCVKCGFRSDYKGDVVKHLKVCPGEKNCYPCDSCRYVTKFKSDLKRHWSLRHGDMVEVDSDESYRPGWD